MNLSVLPKQKSRSGAFTLMELLVVITIILILAGMAFPGAKGVLDRARKTSAENAALQLKQSIAAYYTEYRRYPLPPGTQGGQDIELRSDNGLMDILLGADGNKGNPRRISFFAGKKAKGNPPRGGIVMSGNGGGELFDPWGEYFYVKMDTDYNNRVTEPFSKSGDASSGNEVPESVLVWSTGPDAGVENKDSDNITTW